MDLETYFRSMTGELRALQNRVRHFIADAHWLTDGEWKESVLKNFLRRNMPDVLGVGRGFIVHPNFTSPQIDIIIYDATKPVLFRDGDLVFVTPASVKAVIEVKTGLTSDTLKKALSRLADISEGLSHVSFAKKLTGLFVYDDLVASDKIVLATLRAAAGTELSRTVDLVSLGQSRFFRWWRKPPDGRSIYERWHSYKVDQKAPAYFIHNVLEEVCGDVVSRNPHLWFPPEGKEAHKTGEIAFLRKVRLPPKANK